MNTFGTFSSILRLILLYFYWSHRCRTFTCNRVFLQCSITTLTEVKDVSTSSTTAQLGVRGGSRGRWAEVGWLVCPGEEKPLTLMEVRVVILVASYWHVACLVRFWISRRINVFALSILFFSLYFFVRAHFPRSFYLTINTFNGLPSQIHVLLYVVHATTLYLHWTIVNAVGWVLSVPNIILIFVT